MREFENLDIPIEEMEKDYEFYALHISAAMKYRKKQVTNTSNQNLDKLFRLAILSKIGIIALKHCGIE